MQLAYYQHSAYPLQPSMPQFGCQPHVNYYYPESRDYVENVHNQSYLRPSFSGSNYRDNGPHGPQRINREPSYYESPRQLLNLCAGHTHQEIDLCEYNNNFKIMCGNSGSTRLYRM